MAGSAVGGVRCGLAGGRGVGDADAAIATTSDVAGVPAAP